MTTGRSRNRMLTGLGLVAVLIGLLWVGQGLNLIPGSFMTGDPKWFVIGAVLTLVGVVLIAAGARRPARRP